MELPHTLHDRYFADLLIKQLRCYNIKDTLLAKSWAREDTRSWNWVIFHTPFFFIIRLIISFKSVLLQPYITNDLNFEIGISKDHLKQKVAIKIVSRSNISHDDELSLRSEVAIGLVKTYLLLFSVEIIK